MSPVSLEDPASNWVVEERIALTNKCRKVDILHCTQHAGGRNPIGPYPLLMGAEPREGICIPGTSMSIATGLGSTCIRELKAPCRSITLAMRGTSGSRSLCGLGFVTRVRFQAYTHNTEDIRWNASARPIPMTLRCDHHDSIQAMNRGGRETCRRVPFERLRQSLTNRSIHVRIGHGMLSASAQFTGDAGGEV